MRESHAQCVTLESPAYRRVHPLTDQFLLSIEATKHCTCSQLKKELNANIGLTGTFMTRRFCCDRMLTCAIWSVAVSRVDQLSQDSNPLGSMNVGTTFDGTASSKRSVVERATCFRATPR